jgi:hypothetical protein
MFKYCKYCGKEIKRKPNEKLFNYNKKVYCDRYCTNRDLSKPKPTETKYCCECGEEIKRGVGVSPSQYNRRKTCNKPKCIRDNISKQTKRVRAEQPKPQKQVKEPKPRAKPRKPKPKPVKRLVRFDLTVTKPFEPPISKHQTIVLEPDSKWEEIKPCSSCGERDANYFTGLCDVCAIDRARITTC